MTYTRANMVAMEIDEELVSCYTRISLVEDGFGWGGLRELNLFTKR